MGQLNPELERIRRDLGVGKEHERRRQLTDEVMFEIVQLCAVYEYRDTYATKQAEDVPTQPARLAAMPTAQVA